MRQESDTHSDRLGELARTKGLYARYASSSRKQRAWAADNRGNQAIRHELLERILDTARAEIEGSGKILDVGCGTGWLLNSLGDRGVATERLHGVDLLPDRVGRARVTRAAGSIQVADSRALPFPDASFDLLLMVTMLSSMASADGVAGALHEARRVLVPGGLLLVYEPRLPNPANSGTRRIRRRAFESTLGPLSSYSSLTLIPQIARRLGRSSDRLYPVLTSCPLLHSHQLVGWRRPSGSA